MVSAKAIMRLEDDIDLPIRKCVGGLAILGFSPVFSCCGFDYEGQPYHKYHQYDRPYIILELSERIPNLLPTNPCMGWHLNLHTKSTVKLEYLVNMNPSWRTRESIHSVEECVLGVQNLETAIVSAVMRVDTPQSVIVRDTNHNYKKNGVRFWQYPSKDDWIVTREWVLS